MAKTMGRKDLMKEVKKLATFQDKALKGKVKGHTEAWLVQVCRAYIRTLCGGGGVCVSCVCGVCVSYVRMHVSM